jgi:hypothetical protein
MTNNMDYDNEPLEGDPQDEIQNPEGEDNEE